MFKFIIKKYNKIYANHSNKVFLITVKIIKNDLFARYSSDKCFVTDFKNMNASFWIHIS